MEEGWGNKTLRCLYMKKIGISLPPDYLAGEADMRSNSFVRALGEVSQALPRLKEKGVGSIELRMVRPGTCPDLVLRALENIRRHGLGFTIHGLLPAIDDQVGELEQFPLWKVADWIRSEQGEVVVTVHSRFLPEAGGDLVKMAEQTRVSLRRLLSEIEHKKAPFVLALEINKMKKRTDPSYTWEGVSSIVESIQHPSLGICWDMGHACYNAQQGLISRLPPPEFTNRVLQTHIHDINSQGQTHWPLREGVVPVQEFCQWLQQHGYSGVYNLEIAPDRFVEDPEIGSLLYNSVESLSRIVQSLGSHEVISR